MDKTDIIKAVSEKTDFTQASVSAVLSALPEVIIEGLNADGKVQIPGICILTAKYKPKSKMKNYLEEGGKDFVVPEKMQVRAKAISTIAVALKMNKGRK